METSSHIEEEDDIFRINVAWNVNILQQKIRNWNEWRKERRHTQKNAVWTKDRPKGN